MNNLDYPNSQLSEHFCPAPASSDNWCCTILPSKKQPKLHVVMYEVTNTHSSVAHMSLRICLLWSANSDVVQGIRTNWKRYWGEGKNFCLLWSLSSLSNGETPNTKRENQVQKMYGPRKINNVLYDRKRSALSGTNSHWLPIDLNEVEGGIAVFANILSAGLSVDLKQFIHFENVINKETKWAAKLQVHVRTESINSWDNSNSWLELSMGSKNSDSGTISSELYCTTSEEQSKQMHIHVCTKKDRPLVCCSL